MNRVTRLSVLILAALAFAPVGAASAAGPDLDAFTPITQTVLAPPAPVLGSDGRYHVVYEIQAVNVSSLPWTVRSITARGTGGRTFLRKSGSRVSTVLVPLGTGKPGNRLEAGQAGVFHLTFSVASKRALPRSIVQVLSLANASRPRQGPAKVTQTSPPSRLVTRAPVVLGPPLEGSNWLAADGCCTAHRHVWSTQPYGGMLHTVQRFAIDWEHLNAQGQLFVGDKKVLTNWSGYGTNVLAVADGTIVHAIDGQPNQVPGEAPVGITPANADGNGVILRLRDGRFVFYAHMIPGSLMVKVGDRVTRGQKLGLLGNSGNSTAPHLHLHVMDRNALLGGNGLPYLFDNFDITGKVASTEAFDQAEATGDPARMGPVRTGVRHDELPLDQVLVTWL
jgi:hypothetical protein